MWQDFLRFSPPSSLEVKKSNTAQDINFINNDDDNNGNDNGKIYIFYYNVYIYIISVFIYDGDLYICRISTGKSCVGRDRKFV